MQHGQFELSVLVDGHPVREFGLTGRTYVEGRRDVAYTLRFRNNSPNRVLVVPSVEGLCTVDGQPATDTSRGYVVSAYSSASIEGWRTSLNDVATFVFSAKKGSYAAKTQGTTANCGVIGCKVFAEKTVPLPTLTVIKEHHHHHHDTPFVYPVYPRPWRPYYDPPWGPLWSATCGTAGTSTTDCAQYDGKINASYTATHEEASNLRSATGAGMMDCKSALKKSSGNVMLATSILRGQGTAQAAATLNCASVAPDFNLGTGWGASKADQVNETTFERAASLGLLEIFYTDAKGLAKVGIDVKKKVAVSAPMPQSFNGFCQAPK